MKLSIKMIEDLSKDKKSLLKRVSDMQLQMESCDLNYCDFLETQFKQYENEELFYNDETKTKGVILHFIERISIGGGVSTSSNTNEIEMTSGYQLAQQTSGAPKYIYMPFDIELTKDAIDKWIETTRNKIRRSWSLYSTDYWYLEKQSCVLVERNKQWIESAIPLIEDTWNIILKERETGYEHRAPKSRKKTAQITDLLSNKCFINVDKLL